MMIRFKGLRMIHTIVSYLLLLSYLSNLLIQMNNQLNHNQCIVSIKYQRTIRKQKDGITPSWIKFSKAMNLFDAKQRGVDTGKEESIQKKVRGEKRTMLGNQQGKIAINKIVKEYRNNSILVERRET